MARILAFTRPGARVAVPGGRTAMAEDGMNHVAVTYERCGNVAGLPKIMGTRGAGKGR